MAFKLKTKVNNDIPPVESKTGITYKDASKIGNDKYKTNQEAYEDNHGKLYEMTHNNTISWRRYVVYMILITMLSCCFTYSKYMSDGNGVSSVTVAKFNYQINSATSNTAIKITDNKLQGGTPTLTFTDDNSLSYVFNVHNYSDVSVVVKPSASVQGFTVTFDGNKTISPGGDASVTMTINPSSAQDGDSKDLTLLFTVEQVD